MTEPKRTILVVAPTPFFADRGTHIRILEEALALEKRGHSVTIATYHIGSDIPKDLHSSIDVRRIRRLLFWYKKLEAGPDWQKIVLDLLLIKKVLFLARTKRPDVIYGHLHEGVLIGWMVQKLLFWRRMILIADFHGSLVNEMVSHAYLGGGILRSLFRCVERFINNLGDQVFASSWENADVIAKTRHDKKCEVLLDGVRLEMFSGKMEKALLREKYGIPKDARVVTYTGALISNKGIRILLEALPKVFDRVPNAFVVIAGFPYDQIAEDIEDKPWRSRVKIISPLSYLSTLPEVLLLSDIGVDPKEVEVRQASGKLLQYMGAGLPIACFGTKNNKRYLGEDSLFASNETADGLADAIIRFAEDHDLREKEGLKNRERARAYTWDVSAEKVERSF